MIDSKQLWATTCFEKASLATGASDDAIISKRLYSQLLWWRRASVVAKTQESAFSSFAMSKKDAHWSSPSIATDTIGKLVKTFATILISTYNQRSIVLQKILSFSIHPSIIHLSPSKSLCLWERTKSFSAILHSKLIPSRPCINWKGRHEMSAHNRRHNHTRHEERTSVEGVFSHVVKRKRDPNAG